MDFNGGKPGCSVPGHFCVTVLCRAPGKTRRSVWSNVCNATEKKFQKAQRTFARSHSTWTLKLHPSGNHPAINLQGRKRLLAASPLNKDTLLPANPAVLPHQRKYGFIPTESICREGNVCLLRPHSTRTRSSLQTHDRTGRICAATRYGAVFSKRAHDAHEFALTASARRSMPRRSSRRSSSFAGVVRPIDSNNHTVATKAKASRAKTPW